MEREELIKKITLKKEFSELPRKDVEAIFEKFDKQIYLDEEKIKLTRDLLRKVYSGFTSQKLLSIKNKDEGWVLRKHLSTRERLPFYEEVYKRILGNLGKNISVIDLGCGINGFSYKYFNKGVSYTGVEAIGQLVELQNYYFKKNKLNARAVHLSLFELEKIKKLIEQTKKPRIVFLFKTVDSLEMIEKDYSKKLLLGISKLADRIIVSFATQSMKKRTHFKVNRNWIISFIQENFKIIDDFVLGGERYIVFRKN